MKSAPLILAFSLAFAGCNKEHPQPVANAPIAGPVHIDAAGKPVAVNMSEKRKESIRMLNEDGLATIPEVLAHHDSLLTLMEAGKITQDSMSSAAVAWMTTYVASHPQEVAAAKQRASGSMAKIDSLKKLYLQRAMASGRRPPGAPAPVLPDTSKR